jgi:hypothetical protein
MDDELSVEDMMWIDYDYHINTGELDFIDDDDVVFSEDELDYEEDPD